jgi:Rha family phage regulatory protein
MNANLDLFPETLLVSRDGERIFTTSLKVAEHFRKRHKNVLRDIAKIIFDLNDEAFSRLNFEPRNYTYKTGKEQLREALMYEISEEGFALLVMGFTGREALGWKRDFLNAFMTMRRALAQLIARYADALDIVRPCLRPVVEGTERGLPRLAIAEPLGKSVASVSYHRRRARELGLLRVA